MSFRKAIARESLRADVKRNQRSRQLCHREYIIRKRGGNKALFANRFVEHQIRPAHRPPDRLANGWFPQTRILHPWPISEVLRGKKALAQRGAA
jgi:hypothetical protein